MDFPILLTVTACLGLQADCEGSIQPLLPVCVSAFGLC